MLSKQSTHFLLMTLAATLATTVIFQALLTTGLTLKMPPVEEARLAYAVILLPAGAAFWVAPDIKTTIEGTAVGMLTSLVYVTVMFLFDQRVDPYILIEYMLYLHYWEMGTFVFVMVTLATICGGGSGWLLNFFAAKHKQVQHRNRAKRFRR